MSAKLDRETVDRAVTTLGAVSRALEKLNSIGKEIKELLGTKIAQLHRVPVIGLRRIVLVKHRGVFADINPLTMEVQCLDSEEGQIMLTESTLDLYRGQMPYVISIWFSDVKVENVLQLAAVEKCSPGTLKALEEELNKLAETAQKSAEQLKQIIALAKMLFGGEQSKQE